MISYRRDKSRNVFSMNDNDLVTLAQVIWLLRHAPPPMGYNRKPLTQKQNKVVEEIYDLIGYPEDYACKLNQHTDQ